MSKDKVESLARAIALKLNPVECRAITNPTAYAVTTDGKPSSWVESCEREIQSLTREIVEEINKHIN